MDKNREDESNINGKGLERRRWDVARSLRMEATEISREFRGVSEAGKKQELDHRNWSEALMGGERAACSGQNRGVCRVHVV